MIIVWLINMLLISFGFSNEPEPKHDLRKPVKKSIIVKLNEVFMRYFGIIAVIAIITALIIFAWACFSFVGAGVESGNYYNNLQKVI